MNDAVYKERGLARRISILPEVMVQPCKLRTINSATEKRTALQLVSGCAELSATGSHWGVSLSQKLKEKRWSGGGDEALKKQAARTDLFQMRVLLRARPAWNRQNLLIQGQNQNGREKKSKIRNRSGTSKFLRDPSAGKRWGSKIAGHKKTHRLETGRSGEPSFFIQLQALFGQNERDGGKERTGWRGNFLG